MNKQKGFTIIELIVVIAIIAVLASIVLVNVTQYINKSKVSAVQGNLATLLTNSAAYFDQNSGNFGSNFIADNSVGAGATSPITTAIKAANGNVALTVLGSGTTQAWCASSPTLAYGSTAASTWCVDSTGFKGAKTCTANTCQ